MTRHKAAQVAGILYGLALLLALLPAGSYWSADPGPHLCTPAIVQVVQGKSADTSEGDECWYKSTRQAGWIALLVMLAVPPGVIYLASADE